MEGNLLCGLLDTSSFLPQLSHCRFSHTHVRCEAQADAISTIFCPQAEQRLSSSGVSSPPWTRFNAYSALHIAPFPAEDRRHCRKRTPDRPDSTDARPVPYSPHTPDSSFPLLQRSSRSRSQILVDSRFYHIGQHGSGHQPEPVLVVTIRVYFDHALVPHCE